MLSIKRTSISTVLILGIVLSACAQAAPQPSAPSVVQETVVVEKLVTPTTTPGRQTIIVGLAAAPDTLDPADHRSRQSETVIRDMFDGLVTRDNISGVHNELAESLTWKDDKTLEIQLRQGVMFHDGTEMTADDVVFTFNRIIQENAIEYPEAHTSPRRGLIAPLVSIEKTGDYTVVMNFSGPWPPALQLLVHQQIVPKAYLEQAGTQGFIEHPIGTGPFMFVSAQPGFTEVVMERFEDYYGGAPDLAPVDAACVQGAVFRVIPEASTRVAALLAGEVDIIQALPPELISTLEQTPGIQVQTVPGTQPKWLELNVNVPPFNDVRVREALNYAVDKELLIEAIYGGNAVALPGPLSPFNNYVNKSLQPYEYSVEKALALLAEAGYADSNGDGLLDKNGQTFSFILDSLEEHRALAEAVAGQFRAIGLDASVRIWEYSVVKPQLQAGERMAYLDDWGDSAFDPVGHFEAKWHSYVEGAAYGRANFSGYSNARVDELIVQGETTADPAERQKLYDEAQQLIYDEVPAVFLILPEEAEAASTRVQNWGPAADSRVNLHDVCLAP
ncbi:MAG TPA: ABC transporter substrate-binding protein [Anaerolineales bacterium]|nr:ABC transporter substrate-binding protein [Anaerolineales bacterium]